MATSPGTTTDLIESAEKSFSSANEKANELFSIQQKISALFKDQEKYTGRITKNLQAQLDTKRQDIETNLGKEREEIQKIIEAYQDLITTRDEGDRKKLEDDIKTSLKEQVILHTALNGLQVKYNASKEEADKILASQDAVESLLKRYTGPFGRIYYQIKDIHKEFSIAFPTVGKWALGAIGVLVITSMILKVILDKFKEMDEAAWKFRETMGMTKDASERIQKSAENIVLQYRYLGVTIEGAYNSYIALGKVMGSVHIVSEKLVGTTSLLKAQLGVSEEITSEFLRNMAGISQSTMESQQEMAMFAVKLSEAAGVPLKEVMGDIAKASSETLVMVSRIPLQIVKSAVEARRLNTTLNEMAGASRKLLNFNESISAEMEASVLIGKNVNFQHARELAYKRNLVGATQEILNLAKKFDFQNMDPFQMEAFAAASGRSVEELNKMLVAEKEWDIIRSDPTLRARVAEYERLYKINEDGAKEAANSAESLLKSKENQAMLTSLTNNWNQILTGAVYPVLKWIGMFFGWIVYLMHGLNKLSLSWIGWLVGASVVLTTILVVLKLIGKALAFAGIGGGASAAASAGGGALGFLTKFGKFFSSVGGIAFIGQMALVGAAVIAFGWALQFAAPGLEAFSKVDMGSVFANMTLLIAILAALGAGIGYTGGVFATLLLLGGGTLLAVGIAFGMFGKLIEPLGTSMSLVGNGIKDMVSGLKSLESLNFATTIKQLSALADAINPLSAAIKGMPTDFGNFSRLMTSISKVSPVPISANAGITSTTLTGDGSNAQSTDPAELNKKTLQAIVDLGNKIEKMKFSFNVDGRELAQAIGYQIDSNGPK